MTLTTLIQMLLLFVTGYAVRSVLRGYRRNRVSRWRHVVKRAR